VGPEPYRHTETAVPIEPEALLLLCNEYPPAPHGGIGTFVKGLARHLTAMGQEVTVIGYDSSVSRTQWQKDGAVDVLRIALRFSRLPSLPIGRCQRGYAVVLDRWYLSRILQQVCRERDIGLVESYDWSGPLWFKPRHVPLVVRLHGANTAHAYYEGRPVSHLLRFMERRNVSMADALVSVSQHIGEITLHALGLNGRSFHVIYNGVDTQMFRPLSVERDESEVLYVGSLHRRKGIHELMRAWPSVVAQMPQARLTVVGRIPDGEPGQILLRSLLSLVPKAAQESISFAGYVPHEQLPLSYSRAAVAVFPSHEEAFGLTCAEAMACGTAVVMTSKGSGPELVENEVSGLLVDPSNIEALAGAIVRLLQNSSLRCELGINARQRAQRMFDGKVLAEQNVQFYAEVVKDYNAH